MLSTGPSGVRDKVPGCSPYGINGRTSGAAVLVYVAAEVTPAFRQSVCLELLQYWSEGLDPQFCYDLIPVSAVSHTISFEPPSPQLSSSCAPHFRIKRQSLVCHGQSVSLASLVISEPHVPSGTHR
ncbi:unnamed protein product [Agarophyton chilense]